MCKQEEEEKKKTVTHTNTKANKCKKLVLFVGEWLLAGWLLLERVIKYVYAMLDNGNSGSLECTIYSGINLGLKTIVYYRMDYSLMYRPDYSLVVYSL